MKRHITRTLVVIVIGAATARAQQWNAPPVTRQPTNQAANAPYHASPHAGAANGNAAGDGYNGYAGAAQGSAAGDGYNAYASGYSGPAQPAAGSQQVAPPPVRQPAYQFANDPNSPEPYAGDGYAGDAAAYDGPPRPAADGIQQVANLSYTHQGEAAAPGAETAPGAAPAGIAGPGMAGPGANGGPSGGFASAVSQECYDPFWAHRTSFIGEWLYLRVRNDGVPNALPQNGVGPGAVPYGSVSANSPTYQPEGFRIGGTLALNPCSSLYFAYTYWQGISNGSTFANPPLVVHSLVTLPQTGTAASDGVAAFSRYNVRFQFADATYRRLISGGQNWYLNYAVGARYANLYQLYGQAQVNGPSQTGVSSNIGMDAAGGRVGLMGARKAACTGFFFYGNAFANILAGNFRASYMQVNNFAGVQGFSSWQTYRPVTILEYELGAGWVSPNGKWRLSGGYYFAAWFNVISTSTYINAVQSNNYGPLTAANNITFDGLVVRAQRMW